MTVLEQRFMERVPVLLNDLINEIRTLRKEVTALRAELNPKSNENE